MNNSRILRIQNVKFSGYYFYVNTNIQRDFEICISVPLNHTISEKIPKKRFEDIKLTTDGSYSMWNSLSKLEKEWNLQGWSTKTQHSLGVFYFGLEGFQRV